MLREATPVRGGEPRVPHGGVGCHPGVGSLTSSTSAASSSPLSSPPLSSWSSSLSAASASTSTPASPTLAATPGPVTKKRVTILDGTGYINGVQIGRIGSGSGSGSGGPGSRCFDILDLNGARDGKNKPPSLGRFAKTPGLLKSAAEIIPDDLTEESETTPVVLPENSASFRKTPGADRNKQRSGSSFSNVSKKRTSSIALLANTGVGIGGTEDDTVEFAHTPADRAKARSHSKAAASSATKVGLLKKFETMEALAASKGDPQPIVLSAQSSSGTSRYINAKVVVAYAGKLEELIIEGLGDRPGTYRGSSTSGLSLQLDRAPIDTDIYGAPSPLAYQPLSKTATSNNNSTFVFDDDDDDEDDDAVANNSWMHGGTSSPHRTYTLTSSNEKLVLSVCRAMQCNYVYCYRPACSCVVIYVACTQLSASYRRVDGGWPGWRAQYRRHHARRTDQGLIALIVCWLQACSFSTRATRFRCHGAIGHRWMLTLVTAA